MKILRVISSLDPSSGGPIEGAKNIDYEISSMGHTVEVVCLENPTKDFLSSYPATVHAIGAAKPGYRYHPNLVDWIKLNRARYDAVVVDGLWQYHSFATWRALSGTNTPYYIFTHGMLGPWFKKKHPFKHLKKWLYWPWAEYRVLRDAKSVLFTCDEERILARESFWLYRANEAITGFGTSSPPSNGQELADGFLAKNQHLKGKRIILFLGRIHKIKGCDLIIKAFSKIAAQDNRLHLVIAGPDQHDLVSALRSDAKNLNIDHRITWLGMLQGNEKWGALYASEVFCLPSHHENFGVVVAEALSCGKPVLISNKVNIWREIKTDYAGFIDDDTEDGTFNNLSRWLALPRSDFDAMSVRAKACFANRFHIRKAAQTLIRVIENDLSTKEH